ncbi:hypothetical protein [Oryzihumus sp.]|uniref:hypothetical protein n=1 Tax=Oryzihumus sp. TaxID=1968903 RepID=UPI002ED9B942
MPDNPHPLADEQPDDLWLLDRLLAGEADAASPALAGLLASAASPASPQELAGEAAAVAAFAQARSGVSSTPVRTRTRSVPVLTTLLASKLAVAAAAGGIALAGTAAAAYTGALPSGLQDLAHHSIGAPATSPRSSISPDPTTSTPTGHPTPNVAATGPDAGGAAAFGLCQAHQHGGLAPTSVAYRSLATAAGGASRISAYCASIAHPGHAGTDHQTAAPTTHRTGAPTGVPTGHRGSAPTSRPTGARTSHPAYSTARK